MKCQHIVQWLLKRFLIFVAIISVIAAIACSAIFIIKFNGHTYSSTVEDWSNSANFFGLIVGFLNLFVLIIFSLLVFQYNEALEKPALGFGTVMKEKETWQITNLEKGAALNIMVTYINGMKIDWENQLVLCYHLFAGGSRDLNWLTGQNPGLIAIIYTDKFENKFFCIVSGDTTHLISIDKRGVPTGKPIAVRYKNNMEIIVTKTFNDVEIRKIYSLKTERFHSVVNTVSSTAGNQPTSTNV